MTYEELRADVERWLSKLALTEERLDQLIKNAEKLLSAPPVLPALSSSLDLDQQINIEQFLRLLPAHKCELTIEHNTHKSDYMTAAEWIEQNPHDVHEDEWVSDKDRERAITSNELWMVRWYPDTPIGSFRVYGSTLAACLQKIAETDWT